ncbi:MAG: hypothetical protein K2Q14_00265 [Gammaproteobacteria bacterium]|nr:hypothetical protein [Gammaproteobacteria bacterium]
MSLINCAEYEHKVSDKAAGCPKCGAPINGSSLEKQRSSIVQAHFNENYFGWLSLQLIAVAIILGVYTRSWIIFACAFLGLLILISIPIIRTIIGIALAVLFGILSYGLGHTYWGISAGCVMGILTFIIVLGINWSGIEYMKDLNRQ